MYKYVWGAVNQNTNEITDIVLDESYCNELIEGYEWKESKLIPADYELAADVYVKELLKKTIEKEFPKWYDEIINKDK